MFLTGKGVESAAEEGASFDTRARVETLSTAPDWRAGAVAANPAVAASALSALQVNHDTHYATLPALLTDAALS